MIDPKRPSREEDFRDYEERDIRDGWPHADSDAPPEAGRNAPYGTQDTNLDRTDDDGVEIAADPERRQVEGAPTPFSDGTDATIADDDLENRIVQALEEDDRIDLETLDLTIREGIAELAGSVDSKDDRRHLIALLRRVKGVRDVRAESLQTRGVDSHLPRDA